MDEPTTPSPGGAGLTTGALARRLGVSPTTLRSWDRRYGIGPAVRDAGRHRRFSPADVLVLEAMCRLTASGVPPAEAARLARQGTRPAPPATGEGPPPGRDTGPASAAGLRRECRGLSRAAVRLDAPAVQELLDRAVARHGLTGAWQEVMVPALHAVGRKWETSGDRYVEVEHLLSWHVSTTLRRHTRPPTCGTDAPVVLACVPGEEHTLPIEALNAALSERQLATRMFGAAVPAEALTAAVRRLGPVAVVLWAQARSMATTALARHVAATRWGVSGARRRPLVMLAGPGWAGRSAADTARPATLSEALDMLSTAAGAPLTPGRGPV
ncbi:MerR family transcriptional regulator [Streptomyces sp. NPDC023723]|uniref:MerR family transcriptional regulator n=1 Tax=Streptomyces sp. NPDC023723 TaxID=3154323 RepID=UPI0033D5971C